jgi:hypothetical protein
MASARFRCLSSCLGVVRESRLVFLSTHILDEPLDVIQNRVVQQETVIHHDDWRRWRSWLLHFWQYTGALAPRARLDA